MVPVASEEDKNFLDRENMEEEAVQQAVRRKFGWLMKTAGLKFWLLKF